MNKNTLKDLLIEAIYRYAAEHTNGNGVYVGAEKVANDIIERLITDGTITEPKTVEASKPELIPLKIEIERNANAANDLNAFFVAINGNQLKNVKRFYVDLDNEKLITENGTHFEPITYGVEYYEDPDFDMIHIEKHYG